MISEPVLSALDRLESVLGVPTAAMPLALENNPNPSLALRNLEAWLVTTGNPRLHLEQLLAHPEALRDALTIFGASQPLADALTQNPELVTLLYEPPISPDDLTVERLGRDARTLVAQAMSYTHALDRIRYLRQRWLVPLVAADLAGRWSPPQVWNGLSVLADAVIGATFELTWKDFAARRNLNWPCEMAVVGFGKLGGGELNYSSDVDLVYLIPDDVDDAQVAEYSRFAEQFGRALSDRMGRGALYRVDLRLRPFGSAGALVRTASSFGHYYANFAEPWEFQALIRSRVIAGSAPLAEFWSQLREKWAFRLRVSEAVFDGLLRDRERLETLRSPDDLKRGPGGIRDVEFAVQFLQLLHGGHHASLRQAGTIASLTALAAAGILSFSDAESLRDHYGFLRQLEHRIQLAGEVQTHDLPSDPELQTALARLMNFADYPALMADLTRRREDIRERYARVTGEVRVSLAADERILAALGSEGAALLRQWMRALPESELFCRQLRENEGSWRRVRRVIDAAPALVPALQASTSLTEQVFSGEIEEGSGEVHLAMPLARLASRAASEWNRGFLAWTITNAGDPGSHAAEVLDAAVRAVREDVQYRGAVIAMGSWGRRELGWRSDGDLVLIAHSATPGDEHAGEQLLARMQEARGAGFPVPIDSRLRPEGKRGIVAPTHTAYQQYAEHAMEPWERLAFTSARPVEDPENVFPSLAHRILGTGLSDADLHDLLQMKYRIETERVPAPQRDRHIKLGHGGLVDIEWILGLHELRYPTATNVAHGAVRTPERLNRLAQAGLIHLAEYVELESGYQWLQSIRWWIELMGGTDDLMPENPDRLARLATVTGHGEPNQLLRYHHAITGRIRALYEELVTRLAA